MSAPNGEIREEERVSFISDFLSAIATAQQAEDVRASLSGEIQAVRDYGSIVFVDLRDATGAVQLIAEKALLSAPCWSTVKGLKPGGTVAILGRGAYSRNGSPSVAISSVEMTAAPTDAPTSWHRVTLYGRIGRRLIAARIKRACLDELCDLGFVEIEPSQIAADWESSGIEPLRILHGGFGPPTYLTTSPYSQLVEAARVLNIDRLCAAGKSFANSVVDEDSGIESTLVMALRRSGSLTDAVNLGGHIVEAVRGAQLGGEAAPLPPMDEWHTVDQVGELANAVESPTVQVAQIEASAPIGQTRAKVSILRFVVPPDTTLMEARVPRAGGDADLSGAAKGELALVVHVDHLVSLFSGISLRDLAP